MSLINVKNSILIFCIKLWGTLIAKEEAVLQGMIDKLIEIGSCYGIEMNVEKQK